MPVLWAHALHDNSRLLHQDPQPWSHSSMPRNLLKTFPTAILRRGMVHFRPAAGAGGRNLTAVERPTAVLESLDPRTEESPALLPSMASTPELRP